MTDIYMSYDNLKRTGQLRNVRVESGFGTVCPLHLSSRTSATQAPSATNICETSAVPTSAGEIEHYLTITPCYHLTILATAGPESQPVMSLNFPLSSSPSN